MSYRVNEIFYTLQGEGAHMGIPAVFIRLSGCNLRCPWCDTDFAEAMPMTAEEIVGEALALYDIPNERRRMVVLTGGEPSLQVDSALVDALHAAGFYICIETNGTHPLPEGIDWITCSPKVECLDTRKSHAGLALRQVNEVKVVYTGEYNPEVWREHLEAEHWMLQPLRYTGEWLLNNCDAFEDDRNDNMDDTVRYILSHPFWRLSIQIHKIVGLR
ncbi:MAG: radical SAM protein [Paludibacteraceae bacterium]|nr:radical SAM protein [Paludibacteraceae bacterium]MBQ2608444.1 radical SAM protein [Paludibacteraceae bacterium]